MLLSKWVRVGDLIGYVLIGVEDIDEIWLVLNQILLL